MGIFQTIRSAVFDPAFYAGMSGRSWTEAAKYYAVVAFVIVFALIAPVWALLLNVSPAMVDTVVAVYPDPLEITIVDGVMSTNQEEPFVIPNTLSQELELPDNIAVFDTKNDDFSPSALSDAHTLVLFKQTFAIVENREQRIFSYGTSSGTSTLTKADITSVAEQLKPYVRPVAIVGGAFLFVLAVLLGGFGMLVFHCIYILFPALLIFVYFKIRKRDDIYKTAYTTALFASIPVTILTVLIGLFGELPPFTYTLLLIILVIVNDQGKPVPAVV